MPWQEGGARRWCAVQRHVLPSPAQVLAAFVDYLKEDKLMHVLDSPSAGLSANLQAFYEATGVQVRGQVPATCPRCGTRTFDVVEGLVATMRTRCSRCEESFDAMVHWAPYGNSLRPFMM